ncbi:MAG TPA: zf-HC2 domain-containing protein [Pyrinomonadaceae bacterium]|jgi:anti-sigma factor RsiW
MMPRRTSGWRAHLPCVSEHRRNLSAYLDGELDTRTRSGVEAHFAKCHSCWAEYNELRFASRALSHFVVPDVPRPLWQPVGPAARSEDAAAIAALKRCWAMKVAIPAPVFAGLLVAIIMGAWLTFSRSNVMQQNVTAQSPVAESTQAKVVEVPVVREVVRERVTTRIVYARQPRPIASGRRRSATEALPDSAFIAERRPVTRGRNTAGPEFTSVSLAGFRPAQTADLRIVKEPEQ